MLSAKSCAAIAPKLEDSFNGVVHEFEEQIEQQVNTSAPEPVFSRIHAAHRDFVTEALRRINLRQIELLQIELAQGQDLIDAKARLTQRGAFAEFRRNMRVRLADARKLMRLAVTFGGWSIEKIVALASVTNIYSLCQSSFAQLVEEFKKMDLLAITPDRIKQMVKAAARPPRKPKQHPESTVELVTDVSGGGRHLSLNLYDDELVVEINSTAEERQITRQEAIAAAFRKSKQVEQAERERSEAIDEVREKHVEMQKEINQQKEIIHQKDERIKELEVQIVKQNAIFRLPNSTTKEQKPAIFVSDFDTWEELAEAVNSDSDRLGAVVKLVSASERSKFIQLLSDFCERETNALDCINWVSPKFLDSALKYLIFSVQRFADTSLADEPVIETVLDCKFVAVKNFGISDERWVFQLPSGKNIQIFERERFAIEKF